MYNGANYITATGETFSSFDYENQSNELIQYVNNTSNNLANYTTNTSNNIIYHIHNLNTLDVCMYTTYILACMYVYYIHTYTCVYANIYIHIYTHTRTHTQL